MVARNLKVPDSAFVSVLRCPVQHEQKFEKMQSLALHVSEKVCLPRPLLAGYWEELAVGWELARPNWEENVSSDNSIFLPHILFILTPN